jgi:hypothetical protein
MSISQKPKHQLRNVESVLSLTGKERERDLENVTDCGERQLGKD